MTSRNPVASVRVNETWRRRCSCRRRSSYAARSASMTLASAIAITRPGVSPAIAAATASSTRWTTSADNRRDSEATLRATHGSASRSRTSAQMWGRRCRRSSTSATAARAASVCTPRATPSSHSDSSRTLGVPSPPTRSSRSPPGGRGRPGAGRGSSRGSLACRSAQCATSSRSSTSTERRCRTPSSSAASVAPASSSSIGWRSMPHSIRTPVRAQDSGPHRAVRHAPSMPVAQRPHICADSALIRRTSAPTRRYCSGDGGEELGGAGRGRRREWPGRWPTRPRSPAGRRPRCRRTPGPWCRGR